MLTSNSFTINLKLMTSKTEIGSCKNPFGPSFPNWEITGPYQFLPQIIWNIYCPSQIVTPDYLFQKQKHLKNLARGKLFQQPYLIRSIADSYRFTLNFKIFKWKTEIDSSRSSFHPSIPNWEITGPYQLLLKIIWNTAFLR